MALTVSHLNVLFGADTRDMDRGFDQLDRRTDRAQRQMSGLGSVALGTMRAVGLGASGAAVALGGIAAAAAGAVGAVGLLGVAAAAQSKKVQSAFGGLADQIKAGIMGAVEPLIPVLVSFAEQAGATFESILPLIERMMAQLAPLVGLLGDQLLQSIEVVAPAFMELFAAGLPVARMLISMLVPAAEGLAFVLSGMATTLAVVGGWLSQHRTLALALAGVLVGLWATVEAVSAALRLWTAAIRVWTVVTKVAAVAQRALNLAMRANPIGLIVTALAALVAGLVIAYRRSETFRAVVNAAFAAVKATVLGVVSWFRESFIPFFTVTLPGAFQSVLAWVRAHWPLLLSILTGPIGAAVIFLVTHWQQIRAAFVAGWQFVSGIWERLWTTVVSTLREAAQQVISALQGLQDRIVGWARDAASWLVDAGRDVIAGLLNGVQDAMAGIAGWLRDHVWEPIVSGVKSLFGISSPSTVFEGMGFNMIRGLIKGLITGNAAKFVSQVFGGVGEAASKALMWLIDNGLVAFEKLAQIAGSVWSKVSGFLGDLFGGLGGGGGVKRWADEAATALAMLGQSMSLVPTVLRLIRIESGGNPNALNLSDINARRGIPSGGLIQVIPPTFQAYRHPGLPNTRFHPLANLYAGLNYALARYGSLTDPDIFVGGYQRGTMRVPETGPAFVHRGEMILPEDLASAVRSSLRDGGRRGDGPLVYIGELSVEQQPEQTTGEALEDAMFTVRSSARGGTLASLAGQG